MSLYRGDCLSVMGKFPDDSIDTIITDPPYGLSFMGKKWDYDVPSVEIWKECLRVLSPGGTALIFAGSRTQHRMAVNVEDAGFILKDCIMWLYGSGFPKATDISKQLDKGHEREYFIDPKWAEKYPNGNNKIIKQSEQVKQAVRSDKPLMTSNPVTPEAQLWNGWKSHGLKPAYEPILVAMKPNDGTYANNALKHGVSGLNIDGGRIGAQAYTQEQWNKKEESRVTGNTYGVHKPSKTEVPQGRFPANIILDEEAGKMLDEQSGERPTSYREGESGSGKQGMFVGSKRMATYKDKGGASRFFYCSKASKKERGADNKHPTVKPLKLMEYLCTLTKTPTGGIVFDPFAGSGTTGLAAMNTGRDFIGIELDEGYFEIMRERLSIFGVTV